jgi:DNA/RNA-binding domain of Phe-tRNA-synthetase-like protein
MSGALPHWITVDDGWRRGFPGAAAGFLAMGDVANPPSHPRLDEKKRELEKLLRERHGSAQIDPACQAILAAYRAYYRRFKKTYHVELQLKSLVSHDKPIPQGAALVEASFMAELKSLLLTAAHDLDAVSMPLVLGCSRGGEQYRLLRGEDQELKPKDMMMSDAAGVICCVIYGSDWRTRITSATRRVLFVTYAPPGIDVSLVARHLRELEDNVRVVAPDAGTEFLETVVAEGGSDDPAATYSRQIA